LARSTVLVIDDEVPIRRFLRASLPKEEFELIEAADAAEGISYVTTHSPDVLLLDLGLPDKDGIEVTRELREWTELPIIVLSARGQERDKVAALEAGADDYLTKPFGINELLARIRVALKHAKQSTKGVEPIFMSQHLKVDLALRRVWVGDKELHLTPFEYRLLGALIKNAGLVVTHKQLLTTVWGPGYSSESHYLRVYMAQLRQKIERVPANPTLLLTEPGVGYRLLTDE